jgi:hypothetical protein
LKQHYWNSWQLKVNTRPSKKPHRKNCTTNVPNVVVDFVTDTVDCDKERAVVEVTLLDVVVCVLLAVLEVLS